MQILGGTSEDHQSLKRWRFSDAAIPKMPPRVRSPRKGNAIFGPVAHLGEHPPCKRKVVGSTPIRSTRNSFQACSLGLVPLMMKMHE